MKRQDMIEALREVKRAAAQVIANWENGDLAGAVNDLRITIGEEVDPILEWWDTDEDDEDDADYDDNGNLKIGVDHFKCSDGRQFATLAEATAHAADVFKKTGVVVAIET